MSTIRPKSFLYHTRVVWEKESMAALSSPGLPNLKVATPPEFRGHEGTWSPETLFVSSVNSCFMSTFLAFARRSRLEFVSYESEAEGLLEMVGGKFVFTRVTLKPRIVVATPDDVARAKEVISSTDENCIVSNSIKAKVIVEPEIKPR